MGNLQKEKKRFDLKKLNRILGPGGTPDSDPETNIIMEAFFTKTKQSPEIEISDEVYHKTYNGLFP